MPDETMFQERSVEQRPTEKIAYRFDTAPYGGSPSGLSVSLYDIGTTTAETAGTDVSGTKLDGGASADGDIVTTPAVQLIEAGHRYRLVCQFASGGNTYAPALIIHGKY